jgi:hypothetical protein
MIRGPTGHPLGPLAVTRHALGETLRNPGAALIVTFSILVGVLALWSPVERLLSAFVDALLHAADTRSALCSAFLALLGTMGLIAASWGLALSLIYKGGTGARHALTCIGAFGSVGIFGGIAVTAAALAGLSATALSFAPELSGEAPRWLPRAMLWALVAGPALLLFVLSVLALHLAIARIAAEDVPGITPWQGLSALAGAMGDLCATPLRSLAQVCALLLASLPLLFVSLATGAGAWLVGSLPARAGLLGCHALSSGIALVWIALGLRHGLRESSSELTIDPPLQEIR